MPNPLLHVTKDFWDVVRDFDRIASESGSGLKPLLPQFEVLKHVDTDRIREVGTEVWGPTDAGDTTLSFSIADLLERVEHATGLVQQGWSGDAFMAFNDRLREIVRTIDEVQQPVQDLAASLDELATAFEDTLGDVISRFAAVGGVIVALGGCPGRPLTVAPEPVVTKILAIVVGIAGALVATIAALGALVVAIEERQAAARAVMDNCAALLKELTPDR